MREAVIVELFVHLGRTDSKIRFVSASANIPDNLVIEVLDAAALPAHWHSFPPIDATMDLGRRWCAGARSVAVKAPSAVVRGEFNYLLNPAHPDFKRLIISNAEVFTFDQRLWKWQSSTKQKAPGQNSTRAGLPGRDV